MNPQSYGSGSAFRIALEARLKDRAAAEGIDLHLDGWVTIMNRFKGLARRLRAKHSCHSQWVPSFPRMRESTSPSVIPDRFRHSRECGNPVFVLVNVPLGAYLPADLIFLNCATVWQPQSRR